MNKILVLLFSLLILFSCSGDKKNTVKVKNSMDSINRVEPIQKLIYRDSTLDFTARFIAGMEQLTFNDFSPLQESSYWKKMKSAADKNWIKLNEDRLDDMREWQSDKFSQLVSDTLTLFYPFSGPDFVSAVLLYPNTKRYIFCALEPIIDLPNLVQLNDHNRTLFLQSTENALRDFYGKSYFITTHMASDFKNDKARGVLPAFYVFMVRTGYEILELNAVGIDPEGNLKDTLIPKRGSNWIDGVRFRFRKSKSNDVKELFYLHADISDKGLKNKPGLLSYVEQEKTLNTFIKSASYLLHYSTFSRLRKFILNHSRSIFQDDTGIPYKYFKDTSVWNTNLYGEYIRPVKDFGDYLIQDDLDSAYQKNPLVEELPFHLGYHWGNKKQSWQLYRKHENL